MRIDNIEKLLMNGKYLDGYTMVDDCGRHVELVSILYTNGVKFLVWCVDGELSV